MDTKPSQEAKNHAAGTAALKTAQQGDAPVMMKKPEEVEADAKAHVLSEGGDPGNDRLVLSRHVMQFGKYKGQNFKWLLENDVRYVAYLVADHQREQEHSVSKSSTTEQKVLQRKMRCCATLTFEAGLVFFLKIKLGEYITKYVNCFHIIPLWFSFVCQW